MPVADTAGVSVSFDGVRLERITKLDVSLGKAARLESTPIGAGALGAGAAARRALRQYVPGDVEPPTVKLEWIGTAAFGAADRGRVGQLVAAWSGGSITGAAEITDIAVSLTVNDVVRGSVTFEFQGF